MKLQRLPRSAITALVAVSAGCTVTSRPVSQVTMGQPTATSAFERALATPGPLRVDRILAADWAVDRAGLINFDHPAAADLEPGLEPIQIYMMAVRHPEHGLFLIDSGVSQEFRNPEGPAFVSWMVKRAMNLEALKVNVDTASWVEANGPVAGAFLSHLHLDHVMGARDLPAGTPLYIGPGEAATTLFMNAAVRGTVDGALGDSARLSELRIPPDPDGVFPGVLDVFGDQSLFVIHVPGHTAGSLAFVARTPDGPVMMTIDTCHTRFGWDHGVESGTYTEDQPAHRERLKALKALAARHPTMTVYLGHQN